MLLTPLILYKQLTAVQLTIFLTVKKIFSYCNNSTINDRAVQLLKIFH